MTPCCGLEMHNLTHTLKLVKDMVITFNLKQHNNFSLGILRGIFIEPLPDIEVAI